MIPSRLKPSLFHILANYRRVPLMRLVHALRYQAARLPDLKLSFSQILIAFNDLHHQTLTQIREEFGEIDEDPIGHLLVDSGRLDAKDLQRLQMKTHGQCLASVLHMPEACEALFDELDMLALSRHERFYAFEVLEKRQMAMKMFKRRLFNSGLISADHFQTLGIGMLEYLPKRFKPLLDVLVLCGEWPDYLQAAVMVESVALTEEPLLQLLCRPGLVDVSVLSRLMYLFDSSTDAGANPAVLLADKRLVTRGGIVMAVQQAYSSLAQERINRTAKSS